MMRSMLSVLKWLLMILKYYDMASFSLGRAQEREGGYHQSGSKIPWIAIPVIMKRPGIFCVRKK